MDGAASPPASAEEEPSSGAVDPDPRRPPAAAAAAMIVPEEDKEEKGQGYVDSLLRVSLHLLRNGFVPEVQRQGLKLMLHLLRFRWDELRIEEWSRSTFGDDADLIAGLYGTTDILPSKSDVAALMAEVTLNGGISLLNDLLPSIISLSKRGPTEAELAAFILKSISDSRIDCGVDPDGAQFEAVLSGLDEALPNIMLILSSLLENHGGAVVAKQPDQLIVSSKKHALTVTACLLAANAYAKCKSFLNFSNTRVLALQFFKVICQRIRPLCATEDYDTAMSLVFWILMSISKDSLTKFKTHSGFLSESQLNFAGRICECLIALGSSNMQFIITDGNRATHFFRQMLEYFQHSKFALHFRSMQFWLMVLKELSKENFVASDPGVVASAVNPASVANSTEKGNNGAFVFVSDYICKGIMDFSLRRILKKSAATSLELLELWSDELHGKNGFIQYRSILLDLIRFIAYKRPIIAASRAVQRINCIIEDASALSKYPKDLAAIESAQLGLEMVVNAIFDDSVMIILDTKFPLLEIYKIFEGLLMQLLSLKWTEPRLVVILGHYLNALCPFLIHFPASVAMVVSKLLELLSSINVDSHDPSKAQYARLQICTCVIHICQAVDGTSLPSDMKGLFSVPHVTEEDVLAFVAINRTAYSVEQKHVRGEGNQDGDATQPSSASYTMPSPPSSYLTLGLRPWALNGENPGLSVALPSFHYLSTTQPSLVSCSVHSFPESNGIACTLSQKKLDHNLILGSVPISWLRLGTKSQSRNKGTSLNLSPASQMSTENCSSSSLPCSSSACLALVKQRQQLHANGELLTHVSPSTQVGESQPINIFEDCGQGNDQEQNTVQGIVTGDFEGSTESVDEKKLGIVGTMSCHQEKDQLLLMEHNILSETFVTVASFPRIQDRNHLLADLLHTLNKIWTQPDWEDTYIRYKYRLSGLFANDQFTRIVHSLVKSFEEEFTGNRVVESAGAQEGYSSAFALDSCTLPKLMLSLILRVLNCIQTLWKEPITYDLSGVIAKDISFLLEDGEHPEIDEAKLLKNAGTWLQGIREAGYNVIGLCASVDGAFYGLLDRSSIVNVLMEKLRSMEFNHLGKLILLVLIPLVKYCPQECWDEWMVELLEPIFSYCEDIFYYAWFTFLHEGQAKVPAYFGNLNGSEEIVNQFEKELLLKFTRSVSDLLGVLASERLNSGLSLLPFRPKDSTKADFQDLKSISSNSLIGFLLHHNCFGRLSMYLFGCLVDHQAAKKALPFCYALICLAIATNLEWLNQFILNEMLPTVILLLGGLRCPISELSSSLNSTTKEDARNDVIHLCQQIYKVYIDNQVIVGEGADSENMSGRFEDWLAKEVEDLRTRSSCSAPEYFPEDAIWKWEFNEEFERYLPAYMNMLDEVDAMNDCLKDTYLGCEILEKLKPEFKSRYGIINYAHPYLRTMSRMLRRKRSAVYYQSRTKWLSQLLSRLITLKPYIKFTDSWESVMERLHENCESQFDPLQCDPASAVTIFFDSILSYWEPQFHPLIRESHKDLLTTIACQLASAEEDVLFEPLEPHPDDFSEYLQPYAWMYIKRKKEESGYFRFEEQVRLHEEFDNHLASGSLDHRMNEFSCSKDDFVHNVVASDFENSPFATLDHDLMKMSFERRAIIVEWEHQISSYSQCLTSLLKSDEMKNELGNLMSALNAEGFFRVNDDSMDWDNKLFSDSVDKFKKVVFSRQCIDKCLVIRGIMDYQNILQMEDINWQDAFRMVVSNTIYLWKENLQQFWVTTRHYKHEYYETLKQPLQKVFLLGGAPKLKYC
ncbi:protein HASTY 1-like isoform X2 [Phragmites australis]|uniref:protein HASTY 1-like isoform X2 n=1 Tax=Phragmites australis TaxID=29695 RepID=UPI002D7725E1|nr:protein HASTY 1-like isoform X2 [Phragmites australis]